MSDKTLVERMREYADTLRKDRGSRLYMPDELDELADAIERDTMPKPLFEDGEPVHEGDTFQRGGAVYEVMSWDARSDGNFMIHCKSMVGVPLLKGERLKRPAPEVLDAEGVPIHKGDTVYLDFEHARYAGKAERVDGVFVGLHGISPQQELVVMKIDNGYKHVCFTERSAHCPAGWLTHKQPDSLERIEQDKRKNKYEYWGCKAMQCSNCPAKIDGKRPWEHYGYSTCIEAQWCDLLRRTCEVLERGR